MRPRNWLSRLAVAAWSGNIALFTLSTPDSIAGVAVQRTGATGYACVVLLAVLAVLALIDNAVNDFMPERWELRLKDYRHIGFMAIAITLVMLGGAITLKCGTTTLLPSYLLPAFFAVVVTWQDIFTRHGATA